VRDKKATGETLRFVLARGIGTVEVVEDPPHEAVQRAVDSVLTA
jgi:3-dehydroquinate synthetase